jgi:hypothetical protein
VNERVPPEFHDLVCWFSKFKMRYDPLWFWLKCRFLDLISGLGGQKPTCFTNSIGVSETGGVQSTLSLFETGSQDVAETVLGIGNPPAWPPKCWDYRSAIPYPIQSTL